MLYNLTEGITIGASLLASFMPETSQRILSELNTDKRNWEDMDTFGLYPNGNRVAEKPEMLFARKDVEQVLQFAESLIPEALKSKEAEAEAAEEKEEKAIEHKPVIDFDDFAKMELRVGEIIACEEVPNSKKLLKETVKLGSETRTILSGIKKWYKPESMVGKKVMVICNLAPRKIAGIESQGMLLCAESEDGEISLMTPDKPESISGGDEIG